MTFDLVGRERPHQDREGPGNRALHGPVVLEVVVGKRAAGLIDTDVRESGRVQNLAIRVRRREREHATRSQSGRRRAVRSRSGEKRPRTTSATDSGPAVPTPHTRADRRRAGLAALRAPLEPALGRASHRTSRARRRRSSPETRGPGRPRRGTRRFQTTGLGTPPGCVDHAHRDVRRDEVTLRADALGREEAGLAGPGGELEDRLARPGIDSFDEPIRHRARA
jgi:hypothetical protein